MPAENEAIWTPVVDGPAPPEPSGVPSPIDLRDQFSAWLAIRRRELAPYCTESGASLEADVEHQSLLVRELYEAGWSRYGWPVECGGLGGTEVHRAVVYDVVCDAGLVLPEVFVLLETLAPPLVRFAPHLAARHLSAYLSGREAWGQGFSEPEAGSDLASVRTRATAAPGGYSLSGQKAWTTLGQCARWAAVLCRTGTVEEAHRGLTMLWVDLEATGVTVRPIRASNGRNEFAELFFTDVFVPTNQVVGELGQGWAVAMYLLQYERGMYAWGRQAVLHRVLRTALETAGDVPVRVQQHVGRAYADLVALRARSGGTVQRLAAGEALGPEASVDKLLLSRAEQSTYDVLRMVNPWSFALGGSTQNEVLRHHWFYSRATSIFGGAADVQRGIVAQRLLDLPREAARGRG